MTLRLSVGQMTVHKADPAANWHTITTLTAEASRQGAQVVVFPELWEAGYALSTAETYASVLGEGSFARLQALATEHNIHIVGSIFEQVVPSGVANTATLICPQTGIRASYRKIHSFPLMDEHLWLTAGDTPVQVTTPWGQVALAICYDLRFPELFRRYAVNGAQMVFLPSQWPQPRIEHFRTLVRARAIENQLYMVAVNRVGHDADTDTHFGGHSLVIDPWGATVLELGENEGVFTVELDMAMVASVRERIPVLTDRRPDVYGRE